MTMQSTIDSCKTVFAVDMADKLSQISGVVFGATRPLLGIELELGEYINGRFHVAVDTTEYHAEAFIKKNIELDARILVPATKHELIEMALLGDEYADSYRALPPDEQFDMLSHEIQDLRDLPHREAIAKLASVRLALAA